MTRISSTYNTPRILKYNIKSGNIVTSGLRMYYLKIAAEGGMITTDGTYRIHTFKNSGTFISYKSMNIEYLVVGGGGAGGGELSAGATGGGGGGGAGGFRTNVGGAGLGVTAQSYSVIVGNSGIGWTGRQAIPASAKGGNSSFNSIISTGGGGGSCYGYDGGIGGSGGGAGSEQTKSGRAGNEGGFTPVEGYAGASVTGSQSGNGGGASEAGTVTSGSATHGGNGYNHPLMECLHIIQVVVVVKKQLRLQVLEV